MVVVVVVAVVIVVFFVASSSSKTRVAFSHAHSNKETEPNEPTHSRKQSHSTSLASVLSRVPLVSQPADARRGAVLLLLLLFSSLLLALSVPAAF